MTKRDIIIPEAQPYSFQLELDKTALLVIDMQNDFCASGGFGEKLGNDIASTKRIIPVVKRVMEAARTHGIKLIHTREGHLPDLSDCPPTKLTRSRKQGAGIGDIGPMGRILIRGEFGHEIVTELTPFPDEIVIDKPGKGAFYQTELHDILQKQGIESLILTGVTTHVCVHTTLREANDRGYECLVIEDATAAFDPNDHDAAIRMVWQQGGIFGWTTSSAHLLAALK